MTGRRALFGVAGNPPNFWTSAFSKDRAEAPTWLASIGLDALEVQCTYGVRMPPDRAAAFLRNSQRSGVVLSIHGPYYIALGTSDVDKRANSVHEVSKAVELAKQIGAGRVVFHLGSDYGDRKQALLNAVAALQAFEHETDLGCVRLFPEIAGKNGQLGSLDDVLTVCEEVRSALPCLDLAHLHAREGEFLGSKTDFDHVFGQVESRLGREALQELHIHMYPIDWGPGGEISHKAFDDTVPQDGQLDLFAEGSGADEPYLPRYEPFIESIVERELAPTIICEAKDSQDVGALAMKSCYLELLGGGGHIE